MNSLVVVLLRMVWWLCAYLLPIDASLAEGFAEEEYFEEEEENFDHYTNQGKPSCNYLASPLASLIIPMFYKVHVLQALPLLRENNWVRSKLVSIVDLKSIKLSLD